MTRDRASPSAAPTLAAVSQVALALSLVSACVHDGLSPGTSVKRILEPLAGAPGRLPEANASCEAGPATGAGGGSPNALVIRVSENCRACETLLRELVANKAQLSARGYELFVMPTEADNCAEVVRQVPPGPYARLPSGREWVAAYPADSTPTLYVLRDGELALRLVGLATVDELLNALDEADHRL